MVLLTDGQMADERLVLREAEELAELEVPVTTLGVGDDVNTDLFTKIADLTQGQPMDVVPDSRARQLTERLKNDTMTRVLDQAIGELQAGKIISVGTAKTLRIGAKTQTLRVEDKTLPTDEEIRRMTGA